MAKWREIVYISRHCRKMSKTKHKGMLNPAGAE